MKKIVLLTFLISVLLSGCNGQKMESAMDKGKRNKPETNITVNKEYDEDGNIVKYDSTYSYYYSNIENNKFAGDSIMKLFRERFNNRYFFSEDPFFDNLFFQDSLLDFDFYKKDFFRNRFFDNWRHMDQLFLEMDSIKNNFFNYQFKADTTGIR